MAAKYGDRVLVHYTAMHTDGSEFDSSRQGDPVPLGLGDGDILPGVERAVVGMSPGETKTARIPPQEAFGERREELVLEFLPEDLPDGTESQVGDRVKLRIPGGHELSARIVEVTDKGVTLDANHPLAGKELIFEVELIAVNP